MERLYITKENFSYLTSILNYADFILALVQESTQDPKVKVNSVVTDPFHNNETYLQYNEAIVNQIFKFVMTYYLRAARITPNVQLDRLIRNIYLKVLDPKHDFQMTDTDLEFCVIFSNFLFKYRKRLVHIGEQVAVDDLFSNILARIHITLEPIRMVAEMREEEERERLKDREPAEL